MRALFLGFGQVGRRLAALLAESPAERRRHPGLNSLELEVVGIVTGSHGAIANPFGLDLARALRELARAGSFAAHPNRIGYGPHNVLAAIHELDYDVLVEMTPLAIRGRGEPAISHVREALRTDHHVVSANKGPIAWAHAELAALARERGLCFLFESTVMDGTPVFNLARHCLRGDTIVRLEGILNSTTNVVLCGMEEGLSFEAALDRARTAGVLEADPADDLEGWDAAVKIAALGNVLLGGTLRPEEVLRESLAEIDGDRLRAAAARGRRIKMVCEVYREGEQLVGRVAARELSLDDPFALVADTSSILRLTTALLGKLVITEEEPDLTTTAFGVLGDLLTIAADCPLAFRRAVEQISDGAPA